MVHEVTGLQEEPTTAVLLNNKLSNCLLNLYAYTLNLFREASLCNGQLLLQQLITGQSADKCLLSAQLQMEHLSSISLPQGQRTSQKSKTNPGASR